MPIRSFLNEVWFRGKRSELEIYNLFLICDKSLNIIDGTANPITNPCINRLKINSNPNLIKQVNINNDCHPLPFELAKPIQTKIHIILKKNIKNDINNFISDDTAYAILNSDECFE